MAKAGDRGSQNQNLSGFLGDQHPQSWQPQIDAIAKRFDQEFRREAFELPPEVEAMPIFQEWISGTLANRIASPFWDLAKPKKNQKCLDIGCGISFLIYPWRDWNAFFFGQEISSVAQEFLNTRGSQLNSKLFKGVKQGAAHTLKYDSEQFDLVIATGFSCYYPLSYWDEVLAMVKKVLKPDGTFVFDVINPETPIAENWAILETYLGAEVFLEPLESWQKLLKTTNIKVVKSQPGELFQLYKVQF